jgi:TolA-binding protein
MAPHLRRLRARTAETGKTMPVSRLKIVPQALLAALIAGAGGAAFSQNELRYDPEKGIMLVDKKDTGKSGPQAKPLVSFDKQAVTGSVPQLPVTARDSTDLHVGRKKDPPALYFNSGLEYFKNADFTHALQNFRYADSVDPKPLYRLWVGRCHRQLKDPAKMVATMEGIVKDHPDCDVAADALFEIAIYYQTTDDYEAASRQLTKLLEQYPFGESYSTGEKFIDIARDRRTRMRAELSNDLAALGYTNEDIAANFLAFQKDHSLKESGVPDLPTVLGIKNAYKKLVDRDQRRKQNENLAQQYLSWAGVAGGAGLLVILVSLILYFRSRGMLRQIEEMNEALAADLDLKKL